MTHDATAADHKLGSIPKPLKRLSTRMLMLTGCALVLLTTVAVVVLWWAGTSGLGGAELVRARFDALKIGFSVGIGSGGIVALYLSWRRQRSAEDTLAHQERVADDTRHDAVERRITELYTKAAEQLGSDKAPVRLAGLYALERLAQDNERQRQTIVNVICAYLRMPYEPPGSRPDGDTEEDERNRYRERVQELQVRITVQRILGNHFHPGQANYWDAINIDLAGAMLFDINAEGFRFHKADLRRAKFMGVTRIDEATFVGKINCQGAVFIGRASFCGATFEGKAVFDDVSFEGEVNFDVRTTFSSAVSFVGATHRGSPLESLINLSPKE